MVQKRMFGDSFIKLPEPSTSNLLDTPNSVSQSLTEQPNINFAHVWRVKPFSLIEEVNVTSCLFSAPNDKVKWYLSLKPKNKSGNKEYIGLSLHMAETGDNAKRSVKAHFIIYLMDRWGKRQFAWICRPQGRTFKHSRNGFGWKLCYPRDEILRSNSGLLSGDDTLAIRCDIRQFGSMQHAMSSLVSPYTSERKERHSFAQDFLRYLKRYCEEDVTLIAKNKVQIKAHQVILAARSEVFRAMFQHETRENESKRVVLEDIDDQVIKEMVYFMYTDSIRQIDTLVEPLLMVADRFQIIKLKMICEEHLIKCINIGTVGHLLAVADMVANGTLKKHCLQYISANASRLSVSPHLNESLSTRPHLYEECFRKLVADKSS